MFNELGFVLRKYLAKASPILFTCTLVYGALFTQSAYAVSPGWNGWGDSQNGLEWKIENGLLTIRPVDNHAEGTMPDVNYNAPWFNAKETVSSLELQGIVSSSQDLNGIFKDMKALTAIDLGHFDTSNVTNMGAMFQKCTKLKLLDVSHFNTAKVTNMGFMFNVCNSLTTIKGLTNFDTSQVEDMQCMFQLCENLTSLDLSHFNTAKVTNMSYMFQLCHALKTIYISDLWKVSQVASSEYMFDDCSSLAGGNGTTYDSSITDKTRAIADGKGGEGYLTYAYSVVSPTIANEPLVYGDDPIFEGGKVVNPLTSAEIPGTWKLDPNFARPQAGETTLSVVFEPSDKSYPVHHNTIKLSQAVAKRPISVAAIPNKSKTHGESDPEFTFTVNNLAAGDTVDDVLTGALSRTAGEEAGTYDITVGSLALKNDGKAYNYLFDATRDFTAATFTIKPKGEVALPTAIEGLIFNGSEQTGVNSVDHVAVTGIKATDAGNYTAEATPEAGYIWSGSDSDASTKTIAWSISRRPITVTATPDQSKTYGEEDPDLTYTVDNLVAGGCG